MKIRKEIYNEITSALKDTSKEKGGILGITDDTITHFCFDKGKFPCSCVYEPDTKLLNEVIEDWESKGVTFLGVIHSHPNGNNFLSKADMEYVKLVRDAMPDLKSLVFPIVSEIDNKVVITFYECINDCERIDVEIIE